MPPRLAVLVPVRDDGPGLARCLRALARQDVSDCEVLVCDDGSVPPLDPETIAVEAVAFRLFRSPGRGPAAARNRLAREASAEYLVFLDADTEPHDDLLARIRGILDAHPDIPAFFGSYDDDPGDRGFVSSYRNLLHHHVHQRAGRFVSTFWCGCGVMARTVFLGAGGLSETYTRPSVEDIELGMRLARRGIRTRVFPELQVRHHKRWTLRSFVATDLLLRGIPWVRLMRTHRQWLFDLNLGWRQRLSALAAAALVVGLLLPRGLAVPTCAAGLAGFAALNLPLLALIARRRGFLAGVVAVPLHLLHTVVSMASLPLGLLPCRRG